MKVSDSKSTLVEKKETILRKCSDEPEALANKNEPEVKETEEKKKPNLASLMSAKSILSKWKTKAAESYERKSTGSVPRGGTKMIFAMSSKEKAEDKASIKIISAKDNRF